MCLSHVHMMDTQEHLIAGRYGEGLRMWPKCPEISCYCLID